MFYKIVLKKPDGRKLMLYSHEPIPAIEAISPSGMPVNPQPHLRWHPLRGEWVDYASYRQERTFLPPPEYNPLAPPIGSDHPTELPAGAYDAAVFENSFPALAESAASSPELIVPTRPGKGTMSSGELAADSASAGKLFSNTAAS